MIRRLVGESRLVDARSNLAEAESRLSDKTRARRAGSPLAISRLVDEADLPVTPEVRGACELLGLDPLHVANEGTMVVAVPVGG